MPQLAMAALGVVILTGCTIQISSGPPPSGSVPPAPLNSAETSASSEQPEDVSTEDVVSSSDTDAAEPLPSTARSDVTESGDRRQCPPGIDLPEGIDSKYCAGIPEDAISGYRAERCITPSGNIACSMQEGSVMCETREAIMIEDFHNPEGDGQCNGFSLTDSASHLCHSEPALWDGFDIDPALWPELSYGDTVFVYEHVCTSETTGLTCWNSETGHGFSLSRLGYSHW